MKEVSKVMGPSASRSGYSCSSRSITNLVRSSQISRKSGRKGKGKLAEEQYGAKKKVRLSTASFQKKVTMVAQSFLLDGQGFPYLAEYCFYYLAGYHDQATACISIEDVGADVQALLTEVCIYIYSDRFLYMLLFTYCTYCYRLMILERTQV